MWDEHVSIDNALMCDGGGGEEWESERGIIDGGKNEKRKNAGRVFFVC